MSYFVLYDPETEDVLSMVDVSGMSVEDLRPLIPEGQAIAETDTWLEDTQPYRFSRGKVRLKLKAKRTAEEKRAAWFLFRQQRNAKLAATDFMVAEDYPLSQADRRALIAKRKASRDIPQKTTNPELAMQMLHTIWSDE